MNILNLKFIFNKIHTINSNLDSILTKIEDSEIVRSIPVDEIEKKIIELRLITIDLVNIQRHYQRKYNQADLKFNKLKNFASSALYDGNENLARELLFKAWKFREEKNHLSFCLDKISKMKTSLKKTLNNVDYKLFKYK